MNYDNCHRRFVRVSIVLLYLTDFIAKTPSFVYSLFIETMIYLYVYLTLFTHCVYTLFALLVLLNSEGR